MLIRDSCNFPQICPANNAVLYPKFGGRKFFQSWYLSTKLHGIISQQNINLTSTILPLVDHGPKLSSPFQLTTVIVCSFQILKRICCWLTWHNNPCFQDFRYCNSNGSGYRISRLGRSHMSAITGQYSVHMMLAVQSIEQWP